MNESVLSELCVLVKKLLQANWEGSGRGGEEFETREKRQKRRNLVESQSKLKKSVHSLILQKIYLK